MSLRHCFRFFYTIRMATALILWDLYFDSEGNISSLRTLVLTAGGGEFTFTLSGLLRDLHQTCINMRDATQEKHTI